jgi:hypothetical protein
LPSATYALVAGTTGTGKTVTLQVLPEGFSRAGTAVFAADIKGDLAGIAMPGDSKPHLREFIRRPFSLGADVNQGASNVSAIAIDVIVAGAIDCARSRINASVVARNHGMREPDSRPVVSVNTNMVVVGDRAIGNRDSGGSNRRPYASSAAARAPEAIVVQGHSVESALKNASHAPGVDDLHAFPGIIRDNHVCDQESRRAEKLHSVRKFQRVQWVTVNDPPELSTMPAFFPSMVR